MLGYSFYMTKAVFLYVNESLLSMHVFVLSCLYWACFFIQDFFTIPIQQ